MSTDPERDDHQEEDDSAGAPGVAGSVDPSAFAQHLVARSSDAVIGMDDECRIVYANAAVEEVFGYDPADLVGQPVTTLVPEQMERRLRQAMQRYVETDQQTEPLSDVRFPGVDRDGNRIQLSMSIFQHADENEEVYFSGIIRDVTERVERELELEQQNEQLTRLASLLSHDLREPLNNARAKLTLAKRSEDERVEYIDEVMDVHERMAELIDDVLTLTTKGQSVGEIHPVELEPTARNACETVGAEDADLVFEESPTILADEERLRTILENLIGNALRHGSDDVTVWVGPLDDGFFVADDGSGIPEDQREEVFEYGHTTSSDGSGLGLAIVRDIAKAHGWSVEAAESRSGGARFEFTNVEIVDDEDA